MHTVQGLLICFDIWLPEPARQLALLGAQVILVPTANGYPANANVISEHIIPARALENGAAVAYCNWVQVRAPVSCLACVTLAYTRLSRRFVAVAAPPCSLWMHQSGPTVPPVLTFHGRSTMSTSSGDVLVFAPGNETVTAMAKFDVTAPNEVYGQFRPVPDLEIRLCSNPT